MDTLRKVPELSLLSYVNGSEAEQAQFIDQLFNGIKDYGFIILVDHTVDQEVIDGSYQAIHSFFQQPLEQKEKLVCPEGGGQRGYTSFGKEHAKDNAVPDLKEFWHVGRELGDGHKFLKYCPPNIWPENNTEFKNNLERLFNSLDECAAIILHALGKALDVSENYFADMIKDGNSILRPIHYPPVENDIPAGAIRAAAHEDINIITLLIGATDSGLQLLDRDGQWLDVATKPGQIVVDSGDMLSRITNGLIPATTHRVINPEDSSSRRYSIPFFVHPHPEATLECIPSCIGDGAKYEPINAHVWLMKRLHEIGLM